MSLRSKLINLERIVKQLRTGRAKPKLIISCPGGVLFPQSKRILNCLGDCVRCSTVS